MRDDIARGHPAAKAAARLGSHDVAAAQPLIELFLDSAHRLDPVGVTDALDAARRSFGLDVTVDAVLLPAMRELGRWWEVGRCDIAHEHLATDLCRTWLAKIPTVESDLEQQGAIVLTCGPRDYHSVGLESLAAMLRQRGWTSLMLGARTPVESVRLAVHESDAVAVVLVSHLSMARRSSVEALRSVQRPRTHLFYAGNAFLTRQSRHGVRGTYLGTNLAQAADLISTVITAEYDGEGLTA
jgi:methylmalonyl-CoA mutase cobalamin-binding subunit